MAHRSVGRSEEGPCYSSSAPTIRERGGGGLSLAPHSVEGESKGASLQCMDGKKANGEEREVLVSSFLPAAKLCSLSLSLHPSFSHPWREKREKREGLSFQPNSRMHFGGSLRSSFGVCAPKPDGAPSQTRTYGCERVGKGRGPTLSISHRKEKTPNNFLLNHRCSEEEEAKPREEKIF